ncbi:MAG: molybdopterin-dependent oxidoreductase [Vampirovibrionales bacterium]|nr:molybdopterin-dependent oxidoreductase [Vampirovibrionales bacterium]
MTRFKSLVNPSSGTQPLDNDAPALPDAPAFSWPATYRFGGLQNLKPEEWSLNTTGMIEKPTRFVYRNILALPQSTQERRWISPDGWSIKASWQGVLLEELVKRIHPEFLRPEFLKPEFSDLGNIWINQENAQGEKEHMLLKDLIEGKALLCHKVNGQPLPWLYGGPVALMVFDRYNYKGLGQISELCFEETAPERPSRHKLKGYPEDGAIAAGDYYAFDLQAFRPLHGPEHFESK